MASPAARPDAMRRHNLALILAEVHRDGALTRAELTARLGVSRSTVGALVTDLVELGLVEERIPTGGSRAGRPSFVVGPRPDGPYVVAADITVHGVTTAAVGLGGVVLDRHALACDTTRPDEAAARIGDSVRALGGRTALSGPPAGGGVSVPGTVDRNSGVVGVAPNLGWRDEAFGDRLAAQVGADVPIAIGNDADLAVLAEHMRGRARGCDDVVFLMGRTGVGAGIIANGVPLRGFGGLAGEIGHNVVDATGPACHCGKAGCLETYVGDSALLAHAGRLGDPGGSSGVFAAARLGDERALFAVRAVAVWLGRAVAELVNTLNPERVLLGGSFSEVYGIARPELEQGLARYVLDGPGETVVLDVPALDTDSTLVGAGEIAFARLLADPLGGQTLAAR